MTLFRSFRERDMRGGSVIDDLVSTVDVCSGETSAPPLQVSLHYCGDKTTSTEINVYMHAGC